MSTKTATIKLPRFKNDLDKGRFVERMTESGIQVKDLAVALGCCEAQVCNLKKLAQDLPRSIKNRIKTNAISSTLVLETLRANDDKTVSDVCDMIEKAFQANPSKPRITKKHIQALQNKHNSITIFKKLVKQYGLGSVKKDMEGEFEMMRGLILGKLDRKALVSGKNSPTRIR